MKIFLEMLLTFLIVLLGGSVIIEFIVDNIEPIRHPATIADYQDVNAFQFFMLIAIGLISLIIYINNTFKIEKRK